MISYDVYGQAFTVDEKDLLFRPAVYGLLIENNQILMSKNERGIWQLPGRRLETDEAPTHVIRHHLRQLTGLTLQVTALVFVEDMFHMDELGQAWHLSGMFYALSRLDTSNALMVSEDVSLRSEWVPLVMLQRENLQFGYEAIQAAILHVQIKKSQTNILDTSIKRALS